ncbi:MAG: molybdopterin converting factor subunit 1 [Myxococcaceae bacterium]
MRIRVLYFAAARERAGRQSEELELSAKTVGEVMDALCKAHGELGAIRKHLRVAVNQEFANDSDPVPDGAEIALIPPVSGGAGRFQIVDRPVRVEEAIALVEGEAFGGLVSFQGNVRNETRGRAVVRLEYEAYAPMAEAKLQEIAEEAKARWPLVRIAVLHRVGVLSPGETAVVIAVAAPHRKEAFRACEHVIDRLKQDVPIWKKEVYADGDVWVGLGP